MKFTRREGRAVKIGSAGIDCNDFGRMSAFWREALHFCLVDTSGT